MVPAVSSISFMASPWLSLAFAVRVRWKAYRLYVCAECATRHSRPPPLRHGRRRTHPRGRGGRGAAARAAPRLAAAPVVLLGLLAALGHDRVRLVGHDWGLLIGYSAAFTRPDRIERFVPIGGVTPWSAL